MEAIRIPLSEGFGADAEPKQRRRPVGVHRSCPSCGNKVAGRVCRECKVDVRELRQALHDGTPDDGESFESRAAGSGIGGGVAMVVISLLWFFGGLAAGHIFFYPPILLVIGLFAIGKGLLSGASASAQPRRRRR